MLIHPSSKETFVAGSIVSKVLNPFFPNVLFKAPWEK